MENNKIKCLQETMDRSVEWGETAGSLLLVTKNGKEECFLKTGYADIENKKPLQRDSLFRLYSMSKPITAAATMILVERGMIDLMDQMGFPYRRMEAEGVLSPVKSLQVNYLKPCTFGDEVEITVGVKDFNGVIITITYDMTLKGSRIFTGSSEHVFLNRDGKFVRMKKVMPAFCEAVGQSMRESIPHGT